MIIDNNYIISRIFALKKEEQSVNTEENNSFLRRIIRKNALLKKMVKPLYVYYKELKQIKNVSENTMVFNDHCGLATNFIRYCMENNVHFDTRDFYPEKDDALIQRHIDYRIKIFIGASAQAMNEEQLECRQLLQNMIRSMKKQKKGYILPLDGRKYYLPRKRIEINTWGYHYGLKQLSDKIKEYINDKDFLDIGAFTGDSALMFLQYQPKCIFAYEPVTESYQDLIKTIEREGITNIHAIKKGMGDKKISMKIVIQDGASSLLTENNDKNKLPAETVEITTIDSECKGKKIGLIKMDIEGFEYFAIKGGLETIKRDKPVLLISIYHTGKDFFEIPPMIKSCVPEYTFRYLDLMPCNSICEKILAGYVDHLV
jgi:FkbM family methyltransferase